MKRFSFPEASNENLPTSFGEQAGSKLSPTDHPHGEFRDVDSGVFDSHDGSNEPGEIFSNPWSASGPAISRPKATHFFAPLHYTATYDYPLIVYLHSGGSNAAELLQVMPHVSMRNYVAVSVGGNRAGDPSGLRFHWSQSDGGVQRATDDVLAAIEEATERYAINTDRIVFAGVREGGSMALRLALELPGRVAGVASIGGRMPDVRIRDWDALREHRTRMLWQWGSENAEYSSETCVEDCRRARQVNARVDIRLYPVDDESTTAVYSDLNHWIMQTIVANRPMQDAWDTSPLACDKN